MWAESIAAMSNCVFNLWERGCHYNAPEVNQTKFLQLYGGRWRKSVRNRRRSYTGVKFEEGSTNEKN